LVRRHDVRGFVERPALWLIRPMRIDAVRKEASTLEVETRLFYEKAAARTQDASIRQLLDDLANEEREQKTGRRSWTSKNFQPALKKMKRKLSGVCSYCRSYNRTRRIDGRLGLDARSGIRGGIATKNSWTHFSWALRHQRERASAWDLPKHFRMTAV